MKKLDIIGKESIEVKRFYIPVNIKINCPDCGEVIEFLKDDYLSYPILNDKLEIYGCCRNCDNEYNMPIILRMGIEYDDESIKKI